ncbi:ras-related protein Rab-34-like isoform X2 [Patiria miniata]|nr:ras-related protein Rab-34-like isoform X2 [Patiria miniata]
MIMVGDASVGKTALIQRFCHGCFPQKYILTVGIEFEVETFYILGVPFKLHIWDTAGEEKFRSIASPYYRGAHVVVIVFDMTNMYSWENVSSWYEEARRQTGGPVHLFLVGSKKDLCTEQQLVKANELGKRMAQQIEAEYWALSSLTGEDVNAFFFRVVCVAFNAAVSREVEARELESKKISMPSERSLIKLNEPPDFQENPPKDPRAAASNVKIYHVSIPLHQC